MLARNTWKYSDTFVVNSIANGYFRMETVILEKGLGIGPNLHFRHLRARTRKCLNRAAVHKHAIDIKDLK